MNGSNIMEPTATTRATQIASAELTSSAVRTTAVWTARFVTMANFATTVRPLHQAESRRPRLQHRREGHAE